MTYLYVWCPKLSSEMSEIKLHVRAMFKLDIFEIEYPLICFLSILFPMIRISNIYMVPDVLKKACNFSDSSWRHQCGI